MTGQDFSLIDPPNGVTRLKPTLRWRDVRIDYRTHPAYAELTRASLGKRVSATGEFAARAALLLAKRLIRYEMIPLDYRKPRNVRDALRFAGTAARNMVVRNGRRGVEVKGTSPITQRLAQDGCAVISIPETRFTGLESVAARYFEMLADRRRRSHNGKREFDDSRQLMNQATAPDLYAEIERTLAEAGVLEAASEYLGRPARLVDVNPQINDVTDGFWREIFPDRELSQLPRAAYYHRDASGGDLKAIFYFSDVGPENGPFGYALGSNSMRFSQIDNLIAEANDHNGFSGTDPVNREKFAALPRLLQQKGSYGNDLDDEAPLSREVMTSTWSITAAKGSIVLFDTKGTHRGGMVEKGERRVVTCVIG